MLKSFLMFLLKFSIVSGLCYFLLLPVAFDRIHQYYAQGLFEMEVNYLPITDEELEEKPELNEYLYSINISYNIKSNDYVRFEFPLAVTDVNINNPFDKNSKIRLEHPNEDIINAYSQLVFLEDEGELTFYIKNQSELKSLELFLGKIVNAHAFVENISDYYSDDTWDMAIAFFKQRNSFDAEKPIMPY